MDNKDKMITEKKSIYAEESIMSTKQMMAYSFGVLGFTLVASLLSGFVLKYAVSILGLPPFFVGSVYSTMLILSAFGGPFFGGLSDNLSLESKIGKKFGKRKPFMIIGAPLFAIFAVWFWSIKPCATFNTLDPVTAIQFIFVLALYRIFESCTVSPYYAMIPEISRDENNRVKLTSYAVVFSMIAGTLGMFIPLMFLAGAADLLEALPEGSAALWAGNPASPGAAIYIQLQIVIILMVIIYLICIAIMVITTKNPKMIEDRGADKRSLNVLRTLKDPFADKNAFRYIIVSFLNTIPLTSFMYLLFNFLDEILHLNSIMYYSGMFLIFVMMGASFAFWGKLSKKKGVKNAYIVCLYLSATALFLLQLTITSLILPELIYQILGLALLSLWCVTVIGGQIFPKAVYSDIIDQAEERTGKSQSGNYSGASGFLNTLGAATSMMISTFFIGLFGKDNIWGYLIIFFISFCLVAVTIPIFKGVVIVGKTIER